jgi:uncharacterized membrane protein (DUF2068 family)
MYNGIKTFLNMVYGMVHIIEGYGMGIMQRHQHRYYAFLIVTSIYNNYGINNAPIDDAFFT